MKIIATIGDCNGIGLEVLVKAVAYLADSGEHVTLDVACNSETIRDYLAKCTMMPDVSIDGNEIHTSKAIISIIECGKRCKVEFGTESADAGLLAIDSVKTAYRLVDEGKYQAMVTMPISKYAIHKSGTAFPGHTELLSSLAGSVEPLMILFSGDFRVALVTVHIPIAAVPGAITKELVCRKARLFYESLKADFSVLKPKIAVLGLNPHAGENGDIGSEELLTIVPAMAALQSEGIDVSGPFPADGFFARGEQMNYDGVLAMYHDQGLIPLKIMADGGVNYTAGLPFVRTSPDHGTAFPIAGRGLADDAGTVNAIVSAIKIVESRRRNAQ